MKNLVIFLMSLVLAACSTKKMLNGQPYTNTYVSKPTFCYQLVPQEQRPGQNCIGTGASK